MTQTDVMRRPVGRARRAAPDTPEGKFDEALREHFLVPWDVGAKIIAVLRGRRRAALLRAVGAALDCPPEEDFGAGAVSAEVAGELALALAQLGRVRPVSAARIIEALRWHPLAIIGELNDLFPRIAGQQPELR